MSIDRWSEDVILVDLSEFAEDKATLLASPQRVG